MQARLLECNLTHEDLSEDARIGHGARHGIVLYFAENDGNTAQLLILRLYVLSRDVFIRRFTPASSIRQNRFLPCSPKVLKFGGWFVDAL